MRKLGRNKYRAQSITVDGIRFDSKREATRWQELLLLQRAGEISNLERQVRIPLHGRDGIATHKSGQQAVYVCDFVYVDWRLNGAKVYEDAKGVETDVFKLKRAILGQQGIEVVTS